MQFGISNPNILFREQLDEIRERVYEASELLGRPDLDGTEEIRRALSGISLLLNHIDALDKKIRRIEDIYLIHTDALKAQVKWLCEQLATNSCGRGVRRMCACSLPYVCAEGDCAQCWREVAEKATQKPLDPLAPRDNDTITE